MKTAARIALGILLGLILATLPFVHYRVVVGADTGGSHAHHTH